MIWVALAFPLMALTAVIVLAVAHLRAGARARHARGRHQ